MRTGRVRWFNDLLGVGFISADGSDEDLLVTTGDPRTDWTVLTSGRRVIFATGPSVALGLCRRAISVRALPNDEDE
jgi:cold shock CspA family protein